jgi:uncharacterized membrane protein
MYKIILALHLIAAVAAIGPLIHAATTAVRGIRTQNASDVTSSSRMVKIYAVASIIVVALGFGLMSMTPPYSDAPAGQIGQLWIWLSLVLWAVGVALSLAVVAPALDRAVKQIAVGPPSSSLRARVAGVGGVIALIFVAIIVLMVYTPGR